MKKITLLVAIGFTSTLLTVSSFAHTVDISKQALSEKQRLEEKQKLADFDRWLDKLSKENALAGSFLFARGGNVLFQKSVGLVHPKKSKKVTAESSINIGSVSKSLTAIAVMLLKQQGKLNYDDRVDKYIHNFPYPTITIRHLLNHTSGLVDYEELTDQYWHQLKFTNQDMVTLFIKHKPELEFEPNSQFEYSNTGYVLLAALVEKISNKSLEHFSKQYIFDPLQMNNTRVFTIFSAEQNFPNRTYGQESGDLFDQYPIEGVTGDGGVYSTPEDLLKLHLGLLNEKLMPRAELEVAFAPVTLNDNTKFNYGFGWMVSDTLPGLQTHDGSWVGFRSLFTRNENTNEFLAFITSGADDELYVKLRNQFLSSTNAELPFARGNFDLCTMSSTAAVCAR